jgi:hypothetical protein
MCIISFIARQAARHKQCKGSYILYSPSGSYGKGKYVTGTLSSVCSPFLDRTELIGYSAAAVNCLLRALVLDRNLFFRENQMTKLKSLTVIGTALLKLLYNRCHLCIFYINNILVNFAAHFLSIIVNH